MKLHPLLALTIMAPALAACGSSGNQQEVAQVDPYTMSMDDIDYNVQVSDPGESVNRDIFEFNKYADEYALKPVAQGYGYLPETVRTGVRNFLVNLREPFNVINNTLQGDFEGAATGTGRFLVNSTVGLAGLIDIGNSQLDWEPEREDFGQTLAVWGVGDGPFVMLPLLGPSNPRDAVGFVVEVVANPVNFIVDDTVFQVATTATEVIDDREQMIEPIEELEANSLDFYSAVKSAYTQVRRAEIAK